MRIVQIGAIWCSSCLVMQKTWESVKQKFPTIKWDHLDLDFDEIETSKYQVGEKLPILILEKHGVEISRLIGEKKIEEVMEWIQNNID